MGASTLPLMARTNGQPEPSVARPAPNASVHAAIKAAAVKAKYGPGLKKKIGRRDDWQEEAWEYFDPVGIIKHGAAFRGNAIAKLRLFAAVRPLDDPEAAPMAVSDPESGIPLPVAIRAQAEIDRVRGPLGGRSEILRVLSMNLDVAGEAAIVCIGPTIRVETDPRRPDIQVEIVTPEAWDVKSVLEVHVKSERDIEIIDEPGAKGKKLDLDDPPNGYIGKDQFCRIYQRHPAWGNKADCHMRGVLSDCEALVLLQNEVKAESKARQSNGLLLIPSEITFAPLEPTDDDSDDPQADNVLAALDELMNAVIDPVVDPSSPHTVWPAPVRAPAEYLKADVFRHLTFHRDSSDRLEQRIDGRVRAIARGISLPVEVTEGHMQTTFANAAQIDQDTFDDYLRPTCELIVDAWTAGLLQPNLVDAGIDPDLAERIIVWYDPADIVETVSAIDSADYGLEHNLVSAEAWRRVKAWNEDDAPEPLEQLVNAILRQRSWDPALVDAVIQALDPSLPAPDVPATVTSSNLQMALLQVLTEARTHDAPLMASRATQAMAKTNPGARLHEIDRVLRTRLLAAANAAMSRVLERAGNRLKGTMRADPATAGLLRTVNPIYAAETLARVAPDVPLGDDLIPPDAFDGLGAQVQTWIANAQAQALAVAAGTVQLSAAHRGQLADRQAQLNVDAWEWMRDELHRLAQTRLVQPDPLVAARGEQDPTSRVPAGLVRQTMARAGGDTGIDTQVADTYVALSNGTPLGGVATGELIVGALTDANVLVEAYQWDYGPAFRQHPFPEHEDLDGTAFANFDADVLTGGTFDATFWPGDHDGCLCDFVPVMVLPEDLEE